MFSDPGAGDGDQVPSGPSVQQRVAGSRQESNIAPSWSASFGSATRSITSTRWSRLRCIMSAEPIQYSSAEPKCSTRECSRNGPRIDRT